MNDLIKLKLVTEDEAECLHRLQVEAFMPLYEKYQDDDTSPAKESLKRVTEKIIDTNSDYYFVVFHGEKVGGVRVSRHKGEKVYKDVNWISPIFIIPELYLFRTPLVENDIRVSVQCFADSNESIDSMLACRSDVTHDSKIFLCAFFTSEAS